MNMGGLNLGQSKPNLQWGFIGDDGNPVYYKQHQNNLINSEYDNNSKSAQIKDDNGNEYIIKFEGTIILQVPKAGEGTVSSVIALDEQGRLIAGQGGIGRGLPQGINPGGVGFGQGMNLGGGLGQGINVGGNLGQGMNVGGSGLGYGMPIGVQVGRGLPQVTNPGGLGFGQWTNVGEGFEQSTSVRLANRKSVMNTGSSNRRSEINTGSQVVNSNYTPQSNKFSQPKLQVQWGFIGNDGNPVPYNESQNFQIEHKYKNNEASIDIKDDNGQEYIITFEGRNMFQISKEKGTTRQVIRDTGNGYKSKNYEMGDIK
jgi:WWE domain